MMPRSRPFLIDLLVVGLACFTIVLASWPERPLQQPVTIRLTDGSEKCVLLAPDSEELESIRQSLREAGRTRISASYAMTTWQKETAAFYADRLPDATTDSNVAVIQTVSHRSAIDDWASHWQRKVADCTERLASEDAIAVRRGVAMAERIRLEPLIAAAPSPATWACGYVAALAAMVIGYFWRERQPVECLPLRSDSSVRGDQRDGSDRLTPMVFRASWVRVVQPVGVRVRGMLGVLLTGTAMVLVVWRFLA